MYFKPFGSNNTNKLSPQELIADELHGMKRSNNTNKLSPQELQGLGRRPEHVQIIQINLVLKNMALNHLYTLVFK